MLRGVFLIYFLLVGQTVLAEICNAKIYSGKTGLQIEWVDFMESIADIDIVAIGEEHGKIEHTKFTACLISHLKDPQNYSLVVEQITSDKQEIIEEYRAEHPEIVSGLGAKLNWWQTGWPSWKTYLPLFESVWRHKVKLVAADKSHFNLNEHIIHRLKAYHTEGYEIVYDIWKKRLNSVYCGRISGEELDVQVIKQMFRDLYMGNIILKESATKSKVLYYSGKSHVNLIVNFKDTKENLSVSTIYLEENNTYLKNIKGINYFVQLQALSDTNPSSIVSSCK